MIYEERSFKRNQFEFSSFFRLGAGARNRWHYQILNLPPPPILIGNEKTDIKNDFAIRFFRSWSRSTQERMQNWEILVPIGGHFFIVTSASRMA